MFDLIYTFKLNLFLTLPKCRCILGEEFSPNDIHERSHIYIGNWPSRRLLSMYKNLGGYTKI